MSKEITFCEEQEGYGDWNKDLIKEPVVNCSICYDVVEVYYKKGNPVWTQGHNAEPISKGRCCNYCNDTKVTPSRLMSIAGVKPIENDIDFLEGQENLSSLNSLRYIERKKNEKT
jgi:hypothetical protein|tara:strand:- start:39 stop:383 length:345 start_codon:yes stop_codon:yes gene_type:complete